MAFGSGSMDFYCTYTYEQAVRLWNETKPWRGEEGSILRPLCRPYGKRKRQHSIIMHDDYVACQLHSTEVVRFHKDGTIELTTGGWDTNLTREFMNAAQPYTVFAHLGDTYVRVLGKDYLLSGNRLLIKNNVVLNPIQEVVPKLDKSIARQIRKNLKPFEDYCATMMALSGGRMDMQQIWSVAIKTRNNAKLREEMHSLAQEGTGISKEFYGELFAKLMNDIPSMAARRNPLKAVIELVREVAYVLGNAIYKVPVEIGTMRPRARWATHTYTGFL